MIWEHSVILPPGLADNLSSNVSTSATFWKEHSHDGPCEGFAIGLCKEMTDRRFKGLQNGGKHR